MRDLNTARFAPRTPFNAGSSSSSDFGVQADFEQQSDVERYQREQAAWQQAVRAAWGH